jgi:hypothetical protein
VTTALVEELDIIDRIHSAHLVTGAIICGYWLPDADVLAALAELILSAEAKATRR